MKFLKSYIKKMNNHYNNIDSRQLHDETYGEGYNFCMYESSYFQYKGTIYYYIYKSMHET